MKSLAKKLLCLIMAMMLVVAFTACGDKDVEESSGSSVVETEKEDKKAKDAEVEEVEEEEEEEEEKTSKKSKKDKESSNPKETVENFYDAVLDLDLDKAEKYAVDVEEALKELGFESFSELMMSIASGEGPEDFPEEYHDDIIAAAEKMLKKAMAKCDYEIIDEVEEDEETYVYTVTVSTPDFDSVDFDSAMGDMGEEMIFELIEEAGISMEDIEAGEVSEEELMDAIMGPMVDMFIERIEEIDLSDLEIIEEEVEFTVVKDGSKWLIEA